MSKLNNYILSKQAWCPRLTVLSRFLWYHKNLLANQKVLKTIFCFPCSCMPYFIVLIAKKRQNTYKKLSYMSHMRIRILSYSVDVIAWYFIYHKTNTAPIQHVLLQQKFQWCLLLLLPSFYTIYFLHNTLLCSI